MSFPIFDRSDLRSPYNLLSRALQAALSIAILFMTTVSLPAAFVPEGPPLAAGNTKFLGCAFSTAQAPNFAAYFNQLTPENAGKWGSVEVTQDVMNWTQLDEAYDFAKSNNLWFRFHILVWGSQQPSWISALTTEQKRVEIEEWFAEVANRYKDLDYIEVVNEPLHAPPNGGQIAYSNPAVYAANYADALGGAGSSGWEWILQSFRLARQYFPGKKLVINEYGVLGNPTRMAQYVEIVNLLKAEDLIDVVAVQAHAFETFGVTTQALTGGLAALAAPGIPIMITEMDIDGATDQAQLTEYQRVFPIFWDHPSVIGVTLWGYRPGLWRNAQGAYLVIADNTERLAMQWLKTYVNIPPVVTASQIFLVQTSAENGTTVGTVLADDATGTTFQGWAITGGTGASYFAINATSGQLTVLDRAGLDLVGVGSCSLQVTVGDGIATSAVGTVTILTPASVVSVPSPPADLTVAEGDDVSFNIVVSGSVATTLQWQVSTDGSHWADLASGGGYSSVTEATLHLVNVTSTLDGHRYRCVITSNLGQVESLPGLLTVYPARPGGFDAEAYLRLNPDVAAAVGNGSDRLGRGWEHFYFYGVYEGRTPDGEFTAEGYLAAWPDLQAVFGTDVRAAAMHWFNQGRYEGRGVPAGFDAIGYLARNPDVQLAFGLDLYGAWKHYFDFGVEEGRVFDDGFRVDEYLAMYTDVPSGRREALLHWLNTGRYESRQGRVPPTFDVNGYLARYADLQAAFGSNRGKAWGHYLDYGAGEGRTDGDFDAIDYLARNGDVYAAFGNDVEAAALHWYLYGRYEGRRIPGGFDAAGYLARYGDLQAAFTYGEGHRADLYGAWLHFYNWGLEEGRVYDDSFRVDEYLARYGDLQAAFGTDRRAALLHWLRFGRGEGRLGRF